jgi:hypothetical protein
MTKGKPIQPIVKKKYKKKKTTKKSSKKIIPKLVIAKDPAFYNATLIRLFQHAAIHKRLDFVKKLYEDGVLK